MPSSAWKKMNYTDRMSFDRLPFRTTAGGRWRGRQPPTIADWSQAWPGGRGAQNGALTSYAVGCVSRSLKVIACVAQPWEGSVHGTPRPGSARRRSAHRPRRLPDGGQRDGPSYAGRSDESGVVGG